MLETYKQLSAKGIIGPTMKVGPDGKTPVVDPAGDQPGTMVMRPFQEFPKAVRRVRMDAEGKESIVTLVAHSKSEELRIMQDTSEMDAPRSPLERERDQLAEDLSVQQKMNGQLAGQLENALARIEQLATQQAKFAEQIASTPQKPEGATGAQKPAAVGVEALALANKKQ